MQRKSNNNNMVEKKKEEEEEAKPLIVCVTVNVRVRVGVFDPVGRREEGR